MSKHPVYLDINFMNVFSSQNYLKIWRTHIPTKFFFGHRPIIYLHISFRKSSTSIQKGIRMAASSTLFTLLTTWSFHLFSRLVNENHFRFGIGIPASNKRNEKMENRRFDFPLPTPLLFLHFWLTFRWLISAEIRWETICNVDTRIHS